jgi:hypothetical protein
LKKLVIIVLFAFTSAITESNPILCPGFNHPLSKIAELPEMPAQFEDNCEEEMLINPGFLEYNEPLKADQPNFGSDFAVKFSPLIWQPPE